MADLIIQVESLAHVLLCLDHVFLCVYVCLWYALGFKHIAGLSTHYGNDIICATNGKILEIVSFFS